MTETVSRVHPWRRRRAPMVLDPVALHAQIAEEAARRKIGWQSGSSPVIASFAARYSKAVDTEAPLEVETESTAAMMFGEQSLTTPAGATSLLVDLWVATEGPTFALHALLRYEGPPTDPYTQQPPCSTRYFASGILGPWARLRERLTEVSDRAYEHARAVAAELRDELDIGRRCAIAYLFPLETAWAKEEAEARERIAEADAHQWSRAHGAFGALASSIDDVATLRTLLENAPMAWGHVLREGHVFTAVDRIGEAILEALPLLDPSANEWGCVTRDEARRVLLDAYGAFTGVGAARGVVDFLADAPLAKAARALLGREPRSGIAAVAEAIGQSARRKKTHGPTLVALASAYPDAAMEALESIGPAARSVLAPWIGEQELFAKKGAKRKAGAKATASARDWLEVASLPRPERVSLAQARALIDALASSRPGEHLARSAVVPPELEGESFEPLAWALVEAWSGAGGPSGDAWVVRALATLGERGAAKRVAARARAWASADAVRAALLCVHAIARMAEVGAIVELDRLTAVGPEIRAAAEAALARVLAERGLGEADLYDRLASTCGLPGNAADGPAAAVVTLDFGTKTLEVRFDDEMSPYLVDAKGDRVANAPRPTRGENAEKAAGARERWNEIKQTLRATVSSETKRFERAMCTRRRWTARSFEEAIVGHPVLRRIAQRLVWLDHGPARPMLFRVAEDGSLADARDEAFRVRGPVGLLHALEATPDERAIWSGILADYELLQPFPQIARDMYRITDGDRGSTRVPGWKDVRANDKAVFMLESRGWNVSRADSGDLTADRMVDEVHGATITFASALQGLVVESVHVSAELGVLDEVTVSELLRDLEWIRGDSSP